MADIGTQIITDINQYLTFKLADEQYAVSVANVKEVLEVTDITKVPRMPVFMSGVINLRGSVVPVIDLKLKFGMGETVNTVNTGIIVTEIDNKLEEAEESEKLVIGVFSDSVQKVLTIEPDEIKPAPKIGIPIDTEFIHGMVQRDGNFIIILDISRILNTEELVTLQNKDNIPISKEKPESGEKEDGR